MKKKTGTIISVIGISFLILLGNGGVMAQGKYKSIKDVNDSDWEKLKTKKIYFGHQSVGYNVMDGMGDLLKSNPKIGLTVRETTNPGDLTEGVFAHAKVGKNKDPKSKIDDFARQMDGGLGNNADIAFFKFCYVDFSSGADVNKVFKEYKEAMEQLKKKYPDTKFVHFTSPYSITKTSFKTWFKDLLGKDEIWQLDGNVRRYEYNQKIRNYYKGKEPVFDIAKIESTRSDGTRAEFERNGKTYYMLDKAYASDEDGHLNAKGRKKVAEKLVLFILNEI